jgi:hypothetical protein
MPGTKPGGEHAAADLRGVDVITLSMNAGEERVEPEEGDEGDGAERRQKPGTEATGGEGIAVSFDPIEDAREGDEANLALEEAEENGLGDMAGLSRREAVADGWTEDDRDGDEGDSEADTDPKGPEEEGEQTHHVRGDSTGWVLASSGRIGVNPSFLTGGVPEKLSRD